MFKMTKIASLVCFLDKSQDKTILVWKGWKLKHVQDGYVGSWHPYKSNKKISESEMQKPRANWFTKSRSKIDS